MNSQDIKIKDLKRAFIFDDRFYKRIYGETYWNSLKIFATSVLASSLFYIIRFGMDFYESAPFDFSSSAIAVATGVALFSQILTFFLTNLITFFGVSLAIAPMIYFISRIRKEGISFRDSHKMSLPLLVPFIILVGVFPAWTSFDYFYLSAFLVSVVIFFLTHKKI